MRFIFLFFISIILYSNLYATFIRDANTSTVLNIQTLQMWQDDSNVTDSQKTWIEAVNYCDTLDLASQTDWRLPNINELNSIVDDSNYDPAIFGIFLNSNTSLFWSSTTYARSGFESSAWSINFRDGKINYASKTASYYVRCVRDFN